MPSTGSREASELMTWALPVLLHRLANHTQWMTGFRSLLQIPGGEELLASKSGDLAEAGRRFQEVGWLMAVLGSAQGGELLLARREPEGLALMFDLVREGLQREGVGPISGPAAWPELAPDALDGWQIPFALGSLIWRAYRDGSQSGRPVELVGQPGAWSVSLPWPQSENGALDAGPYRLPGVDFHVRPGQALDFCLPKAWFLA